MDTRDNKFTLEQLVLIGDHLHNAETAIIMIKGEVVGDKDNSICCIKGDSDVLAKLLYIACKHDKVVVELFTRVLLEVATEELAEIMTKNK